MFLFVLPSRFQQLQKKHQHLHRDTLVSYLFWLATQEVRNNNNNFALHFRSFLFDAFSYSIIRLSIACIRFVAGHYFLLTRNCSWSIQSFFLSQGAAKLLKRILDFIRNYSIAKFNRWKMEEMRIHSKIRYVFYFFILIFGTKTFGNNRRNLTFTTWVRCMVSSIGMKFVFCIRTVKYAVQ